jgi:hypothetical protein
LTRMMNGIIVGVKSFYDYIHAHIQVPNVFSGCGSPVV